MHCNLLFPPKQISLFTLRCSDEMISQWPRMTLKMALTCNFTIAISCWCFTHWMKGMLTLHDTWYKLLMSPWCWLLEKNDGFSFSMSKQTTLLLKSQEEDEDLVPTGLWGIVVYILLANLYIISSPNTTKCRKIMQIMSQRSAVLNKPPWPIRIYRRAKGHENHVIVIWLEL